MLRRCTNVDQKHHITVYKDNFAILEFESDRHKIAKTFENVYFIKREKKKKGNQKRKKKVKAEA